MQFAALPLVDNDALARFEYEIHVYTGFTKGAETESNVSIVLVGTLGDSGERYLRDGIRKVRKAIEQLLSVSVFCNKFIYLSTY